MENFLSLIDSLYKLVLLENGKISWSKTLMLLLLVPMILGYYHRGDIRGFVKEISYEQYLSSQKTLSEEDFLRVVSDHIDSAYLTMKPDVVGVFRYEPPGENLYESLLSYRGSLPKGTVESDWLKQGIRRTSEEYINHTHWLPYYTSWELDFLSKRFDLEYLKGKPWRYSCPIFNLNSTYVGYMDFRWDSSPDLVFDDYSGFIRSMYTTCAFSAREIGLSWVD